MKKIFGCLLFVITFQFAKAQSGYIVKFRDKATSPYSLSAPAAYLSAKSIQRRTKYSIALDSTDLPVTPRYLDSLRLAGNVTILNASKWLNQVSIRTTDAAALAKINGFPFVLTVSQTAPRPSGSHAQPGPGEAPHETLLPGASKTNDITADYFDYGFSSSQVNLHNGSFLHNIGLRGQTMVMGILDAGFKNYLSVKAFDSARSNGQVLGVYDFVALDNSVNEDDSHGMECFSIIAANIPGQFVGTAPKASFYLFRSEDKGPEYPAEEHNWVCAAERLDSLGGDMISTSVGYNIFDAQYSAFNHSYSDMNGNITMAARGADLAAKKGILVVTSAGNEGTSTWHYISTPADADSALVVGAVNNSGIVAPFSSYGPSFDGQIKPDVASMGVSTIIQLASDNIGTGSGTSYAAPNMAGLTACLWQGFPEFNNMKIINAIRASGNQAATPDARTGYGIPDMKKALMLLLKDYAVSSATLSNCRTTVSWTSKDVGAMKYEIERKLSNQSSFTKIGEQMGSGSLFGTRPSYQFQDVLSSTPAGTISYRIRQIIDTSAAGFFADYIDTATVTATACNATAINPVDPNSNAITILPNPAVEKFWVRINGSPSTGTHSIRVFNAKGQLISTISQPAASSLIEITSSRWAKGKYYVTLYKGDQLITTKELIKL